MKNKKPPQILLSPSGTEKVKRGRKRERKKERERERKKEREREEERCLIFRDER